MTIGWKVNKRCVPNGIYRQSVARKHRPWARSGGLSNGRCRKKICCRSRKNRPHSQQRQQEEPKVPRRVARTMIVPCHHVKSRTTETDTDTRIAFVVKMTSNRKRPHAPTLEICFLFLATLLASSSSFESQQNLTY